MKTPTLIRWHKIGMHNLNSSLWCHIPYADHLTNTMTHTHTHATVFIFRNGNEYEKSMQIQVSQPLLQQSFNHIIL